VDIFDLSGRPVAQVGPVAHTAGTARISWDGRDGGGELVPPGIYIYHLNLSGQGSASKTGTLGLAY
jgi:hypothetical protein